MNLKTSDRLVIVTLSKRNVLSLLHKLEMEGSKRTLTRECDDGKLVVKVEPNAEHYGTRQPGVMHPKTEEFVRLREATG